MGHSYKMSEEEGKVYISGLVERSRAAARVAEKFTQRKVDELAAAIVYTLSRTELAEEIAQLALRESNMGRVDSKIAKLAQKMPAILYDILKVKTVGIVSEAPELGIVEIAKPIGVIAALVPSTNPEATPVFKGVLGIRGRNAVIFSPHPATLETTMKVASIMRSVLSKNGAPEDLFICIDKPSILVSNMLMKLADITMATGSGDMVKAAYSSGKPAYGVGAGNVVVVVDETADITDAAEKIYMSKTNDWASGCSAENAVMLQESIYNQMITELEKLGGYLVTTAEKEKLEKTMWPDGTHINREIVARPATKIAQLANIDVPADTRFIMVEETHYGEKYNFSHEKLSVVLAVYKYDTIEEAIEKINRIQRYSGFGHSCGIHSTNEAHIRAVALGTYTARVTVRQPHSLSNAGAWHNGLPKTFSLGCGTWGGNIVSENITQKHYVNTTRLVYPIDRGCVSDDEIYGDLLDHITI